MEVLSGVLIKEVAGATDKVAYIDNLPKKFLYQRVRKMIVDPYDPQQRVVPEYQLVDGKKVPTNAFVDEILPGIERSQTGDDAYVFFTVYNEAKAKLAAIDHYIKMSMPIAERIQERIPLALQPGLMSSGPRPLSDIPHVVLPAPVSPPAQAVQEGTPVAALAPQKKARKPMTELQKEEARKRMARAREVARAQKVGDISK